MFGKKLVKALQYFKEKGKLTYHVTSKVQALLQDVVNAFDTRIQQALQGLDVMSTDEVRDLVDQLSQRVYDLENGFGATTHFHMIKPDDVDSSFASISVDMGKHTAPRAPPPIQITPEKEDDGLDPLLVADIKQQLCEGEKKTRGYVVFSSQDTTKRRC